MKEVYAQGTRCPHCHTRQITCAFYLGKPRESEALSSAAVIQCEKCNKDFFSERDICSINWPIEDGELAHLKERYGYVTKESVAEQKREIEETLKTIF